MANTKRKLKNYTLPQGDYNENFIKFLAMAIHLNLIEPEELTFWFESGKVVNQISLELMVRIQANR